MTYNATNWVTSGTGNNVTTTQVKNFYIKDTPTGLAIDRNTVKVSVNGTELAGSAFTSSVDSNTGALTITIPWVDSDNNSMYAPAGDKNSNIPVIVDYKINSYTNWHYCVILNTSIIRRY